VGFTREELEQYRGKTVDDLVAPGCRLLFVGINPGLWRTVARFDALHGGRNS